TEEIADRDSAGGAGVEGREAAAGRRFGEVADVEAERLSEGIRGRDGRDGGNDGSRAVEVHSARRPAARDRRDIDIAQEYAAVVGRRASDDRGAPGHQVMGAVANAEDLRRTGHAAADRAPGASAQVENREVAGSQPVD